MQDHLIGVRPDDPDSAAVYMLTVKPCDYHRFYGRSDAEERMLACRTAMPFAPDRLRNPSSERLPIAIVYLDEKLLGHCLNQLIRQTTKHDTAALADCYAFGVRSVAGLRSDHNRAEVIKMHYLAAARIKWAPATIARVHDWVPVSPFNNLAVYTRPATMRMLRRLSSLVVAVDFAAEYGYYYGVPHWVLERRVNGDFPLIGPAEMDFYIPPEEEVEQHIVLEGARGACGRRAVERCAPSDEDKVYRTLREHDGATAKRIGEIVGITIKQTNRALYRLMDRRLSIKFGEKKPVMWFNTVDQPCEWEVTVRDMDPELDHISKGG